MPLYFHDNIKINPAKGVLLDSGLIQTAFTMFIGPLTLCKDEPRAVYNFHTHRLALIRA